MEYRIITYYKQHLLHIKMWSFGVTAENSPYSCNQTNILYYSINLQFDSLIFHSSKLFHQKS